MLSKFKKIFPSRLKRNIRQCLQNIVDYPAYCLSRRTPIDTNIRHIVFVCKGNICRSAFAELYMKTIISKNDFIIESCGLDVSKAILSPSEAVETGRNFGIDLSSHRSKRLSQCDLKNADLIVPMEYNHYRRLVAMFPEYRDKIVLLRQFAGFPRNLACNIYDPYGLDHPEFQRCFRLIQISLEGLIKHFGLPDKHD